MPMASSGRPKPARMDGQPTPSRPSGRPRATNAMNASRIRPARGWAFALANRDMKSASLREIDNESSSLSAKEQIRGTYSMECGAGKGGCRQRILRLRSANGVGVRSAQDAPPDLLSWVAPLRVLRQICCRGSRRSGCSARSAVVGRSAQDALISDSGAAGRMIGGIGVRRKLEYNLGVRASLVFPRGVSFGAVRYPGFCCAAL